MRLVVDQVAARRWLAKADHLTKIDLSTVLALAKELERGGFEDNEITFERGNLTDGRHRLLAICVSGQSTELTIHHL